MELNKLEYQSSSKFWELRDTDREASRKYSTIAAECGAKLNSYYIFMVASVNNILKPICIEGYHSIRPSQEILDIAGSEYKLLNYCMINTNHYYLNIILNNYAIVIRYKHNGEII